MVTVSQSWAVQMENWRNQCAEFAKIDKIGNVMSEAVNLMNALTAHPVSIADLENAVDSLSTTRSTAMRNNGAHLQESDPTSPTELNMVAEYVTNRGEDETIDGSHAGPNKSSTELTYANDPIAKRESVEFDSEASNDFSMEDSMEGSIKEESGETIKTEETVPETSKTYINPNDYCFLPKEELKEEVEDAEMSPSTDKPIDNSFKSLTTLQKSSSTLRKSFGTSSAVMVQCKFCDKLVLRSNRTAHERIHTGERPHKCDQCSSAFVTRSQLQTHKRSHTGERPFKCDVCTKSYTAKKQMLVHRKNRHPTAAPIA